jgi:hypothetical protein
VAAGYDYARNALDLIDEFDRLDNVEAVMQRFSLALSDFGYTAFLITGVPELPVRMTIDEQTLRSTRAYHGIDGASLIVNRSGPARIAAA